MLLSPSSENHLQGNQELTVADAAPVYNDETTESNQQTDLSYFDTAKDHLKYIIPFIPADIIITGSSLITSKLLSDAGSEVIAALPYIYGFNALTISAKTLFVSTGMCAANALGKEDIGKINTILKQSMVIAGGMSIPFLIVLYQGGNITKLMGAPINVEHIVQTYLNQYGWGVPLYFINAGLSQITIPFSTVPSSASAIVNTLTTGSLSFIFTKGFFFIRPMPIAGVALAFSITYALSDLVFTGYMLSQSRYRNIFANSNDRSHYNAFKKIMNIGLPSVLNTFSQIASSIVASTTISAMLNETALQQHGLTIMPMAFLQTFIAYNGDAASVLISKQLGAQHKETIKKYVNTAHAFGVSCGILGIAGIGGIAETYIRYYTDSSIATPEFISTTRNLLFLSSLNQTISSVGVTSVGSLRGIDENWRPLIINLGLKLGLNLLASFLLMYGTDLGVYSPYVSDLIVSSVFYAPLLFYYCKTKVASFTYQVANEDIELVSSVTSQNTSSSQLDLTETSLSEVEKDHQSFSTVKSFLGWIYPSSRASNPVAPNDEVTENRTSLRRRWFLV